jgi:hypothetical protein
LRQKAKKDKPISLRPLSFEDAVRAALSTGKMPKPKPKRAKKRLGGRKAK